MLFAVLPVLCTSVQSSVSDQLWFENSEIEAASHGEFEYECLRIATHAVMSWHSYTHSKQTKKRLPITDFTLLTDFSIIAEGYHFNIMIFVISRTCTYGLIFFYIFPCTRSWLNYEWVALGTASRALALRSRALKAEPQATHSYQFNNTYLLYIKSLLLFKIDSQVLAVWQLHYYHSLYKQIYHY